MPYISLLDFGLLQNCASYITQYEACKICRSQKVGTSVDVTHHFDHVRVIGHNTRWLGEYSSPDNVAGIIVDVTHNPWS
jgi:hypothetical protein